MKSSFLSHRMSDGFTLMEILVALVIVTITFATAFMSISANSRSLLYLQNKTAANWVALNVISAAQLGLLNITSDSPRVASTERMFNKTWYWYADLKTTENTAVSRLDVKVKQTENSPDIIHLIGYLRSNS